MVRKLSGALVVICILTSCSGKDRSDDRSDMGSSVDGGNVDANVMLPDGRVVTCTPVDPATICAELGAECGVPVIDDDPDCPPPDVDCGSCEAPEVCGGELPNECDLPAGWFGLAGSDFGPWDERVFWSSTEGGGIATMRRSPSLALASDGTLFAAFDGSPSGALELRRYDGAWEDVVDPALDVGIFEEARGARLRVDSAGRLIVLAQTAEDILVKRFDGQSWEELAGPGEINPDEIFRASDIALGPDDEIWVAWAYRTRADTTQYLYVKHFDGEQWSEVAGSASGSGLRGDIRGAQIDVDSTGAPHVMTSASGTPVVFSWDGVAWQEQAVPDTVPMSSFAVDSADRWIAAGRDDMSVLSVNRWDGNGWSPLLDGLDDSAPSTRAILFEGLDGELVLLAGEDSATFHQLDGDTWTPIGTPSESSVTRNTGYSAAVAGSRVVAAWDAEYEYNYGVRVAQYDGEWSALGEGNATGAGIAGADLEPVEPRLAAGASGQILAGWLEQEFVHVRILADGEWSELGAGSASGEGLFGMADDIAVAMWEDTPWIAYRVNTRNYVKRFDGGEWQDVGDIGGLLGGLHVVGPDTVWVVVSQTSNPYNVLLYEYTGATGEWVSLGERGGGTVARDVVSAVDANGHLHISWRDSNDTGRWHTKFDGTDWEDTNLGFDPEVGRVGLAPTADGEVVVVGREDGVIRAVDLAGEDAGCGELANASDYFDVLGGQAATIGPHGMPIAAWSNTTSGEKEIMVARLEPTGWQGIFGSDEGAGVSNSLSPSWNPTLQTVGDKICVSWRELGAEGVDLVLRCAYPRPADPNAEPEQCGEPTPDLPIIGRFGGNPVDCATQIPSSSQQNVRMTFTFTDDTMSVSGSFPSGAMTCSTSGSGDILGLTETSFTLSGYDTTSTNCNWGLFLASTTYSFSYEFSDAEMNELFLQPNSGECYSLTRN